MMRQAFMAVGLATALAVPTGLAVVAADGASAQTPVTFLDQSQDRDQDRDYCDLYDADVTRTQDRDQVRDYTLYDPDTVQARDRDRDRDCLLSDGDVAQPQQRLRDQAPRPEFGYGVADGSTGGHGEGVLDGTGPLHDGPEDGTGNQFGSARR